MAPGQSPSRIHPGKGPSSVGRFYQTRKAGAPARIPPSPPVAIPATIFFLDMEASITPPGGYLEPQPLTMGPDAQANDLRIQFVTGSETGTGSSAEAVEMVPDPPTGFTAGYALDPTYETEGVNWRYLLPNDPDVAVSWIKPTGWRHWCWALLTARGVDPNTVPQSGALWPTITHFVGNSYFTAGPITVPGPGTMIFAVGAIADSQGGWPSWGTSIGCPDGWLNLTATDKSGVNYYAFDESNSFAVFAQEYASAGTTGTITFPCDPGSHGFTGLWMWIAPAPGYVSTGGNITDTSSIGASSSSSATNPHSYGGAIVATDSISTAFNPLISQWISDPEPLTGDPVASSLVQWVMGAAEPVITPVGSLFSAFGTGLTTLAVTTYTVGDVIMLSTAVGSNTVTATGVSGGNVPSSGPGAWQRVVVPVNDAGIVVNVDMWMGTVNAVGPATITVAYSASVASLPCYYDARMFSTGVAGTVWAVDGAQASGADHAASLSIAFPALAASGSNELYYGLAWSGQTSGVAGSTPGFSYALDSIGRIATWNTSVSGTVAPTASQTTSGSYISSAVLLTATLPVAQPSTVTVETSINNQLSWDLATNGQPIPRLRQGDIVTRTVMSRVTFTKVNASDPTPALASLLVQPYATKLTDELLPTFYGPVDKTTTKITAGSTGGTGVTSSGTGVTTSGGGMYGGGAVMQIHATDPSRLITLAQWEQAFTGPTNTRFDQVGKAMLLNRRPQQRLFNQVTSYLNADSSLLVWGLGGKGGDPWQDIRGVFTGVGQECFFDVTGTFVSRPVPDPRRSPSVWNFDHTQNPCMIGVENQLDTALLCNGYVIFGQSTNSSNPVNAYAYDTDLASKYNIYPPPIGIGKRIQVLTFSTVVTTAQCQAIADALLANSLGLANTCTIGIVPHPGIQAGDIARINSPETGVVGRFLIQGYTVPDGLDQMQLTCFRQTDNP